MILRNQYQTTLAGISHTGGILKENKSNSLTKMEYRPFYQ